MHGGHQPLHNAEVLVHYLGQRRQAVRGARGVGHHGVRRLVVLVVDTHNVHGHRVLRRSRDDDLLRASLEVELCPLLLSEDARGLADVVGAALAPGDASWVLLAKDAHLSPVHDQELLAADHARGDDSREPSVHRVVLEQIHDVVKGHEGLVDGSHRDSVIQQRCAEDKAPDAAKAVDAHAGGRNVCELDELLEGIDAVALRRSCHRDVLARERVAHQELLAHLRLAPHDRLIQGRSAHATELRNTLLDAISKWKILAQVAVLPIRDEAPVSFHHGVGEPPVTLAAPHRCLEAAPVVDVCWVRLLVPIVNVNDARHVQMRRLLFDRGSRLHELLAAAIQHVRSEVGEPLVEERLLRDGLAVPVFPLAVHDWGMHHCEQVRLQIVGSEVHDRELAQQPLHQRHSVGGVNVAQARVEGA
mmetsp:Transcript_31786/g.101258  ORF Transcript_31786/g.101258 Transcript_31786/m.101258 type:complete len:417 (-) Transcript_31786:565-1815(-)